MSSADPADVDADAAARPELHVVAGVLMDADGRLLLAQRPTGREDAGHWEFPGGKREAAESDPVALARELREELGITIGPTRPLISLPQRQPGRCLWLHALAVDRWEGELRALDAQALRWQAAAEIDATELVPADRPILAVLRQPAHYWISPPQFADAASLHSLLQRAEQGGARRLLLRQPGMPLAQLRPLAERAAQRCLGSGIELLLSARERGVLELARELGCGAQLAQSLLERVETRPPGLSLLAASCHDAASLRQAETIGCDFATLSPVQATASHPLAEPIGWSGFATLRAHTSLPVYALGGVGPAQLVAARAQGVAGIGAFFGRG
jgi:8-oxo-dGTP diphosphatase